MIRKIDLHPEMNWTFSTYTAAGDFIYTSMVRGDGKGIEEQTENTFRNLEKVLQHAGAVLDDVVKVMSNFLLE